MASCRVCGIELNDDNRYPSFKKNWINICIDCEVKRVNEYRKNHKPQLNEYARNRRRKSIIETCDKEGKKKYFKNVNKREYNGKCEICNREMKRLGYHHWDDLHPENGIWVCRTCHITVEKIEKIPDIKELYNSFKTKIEKGEC